MKKNINQFKLYGATDTQAVVDKDGLINYIGGNPIVFAGGENED